MRSAVKTSIIRKQAGRPAVEPVRKVGFYGCNGKVVRLDATTTLFPMILWMVQCPACGHGHQTKPFWRHYDERIDAGKDCVLLELQADE